VGSGRPKSVNDNRNKSHEGTKVEGRQRRLKKKLPDQTAGSQKKPARNGRGPASLLSQKKREEERERNCAHEKNYVEKNAPGRNRAEPQQKKKTRPIRKHDGMPNGRSSTSRKNRAGAKERNRGDTKTGSARLINQTPRMVTVAYRRRKVKSG